MTFWHRSHPKARKEHTCSMCRRTIYVGEHYMLGKGIEPGQIWSWRECLHCEPLFQFLYRQFGDECYYAEFAHEWDPMNLAEMRVMAQWRMKWQRKDGGLQPIPELVYEESPYHKGSMVLTGITSGTEHWPVGISPTLKKEEAPCPSPTTESR